MKRLIIRNCRDSAVDPDWKWEVWCKDTHDPRADPLFVGYGSYSGCLVMANLLTVLHSIPTFEFAGFSTTAVL